jgi:predicted dehydrogenase
VLLDVLTDLVPNEVNLAVHSRSNAVGMHTWAVGRGVADRINVSDTWPVDVAPRDAVIIATAASGHQQAVEWSLSRGAHALVEKPLALSGPAAERLVTLSSSRGNLLAAAQVFLYARYLDRFIDLTTGPSPIRWLGIEWADPASERRYGEAKCYDPGLPIFKDVLPHVVPIAATILGGLPSACNLEEVSRGGATCRLRLLFGQADCQIVLERNAAMRRRLIRARTEKMQYELDFSHEPGTISFGGAKVSGDDDWNHEPRPVARMLSAFLRWAAGGVKDARLDPVYGVRACYLSDQVDLEYQPRLQAWLADRLSRAGERIDNDDEDVRYAMTERGSGK